MRIPPDHMWIWHFVTFWLILAALFVVLERSA
jgi:hypothetical protein